MLAVFEELVVPITCERRAKNIRLWSMSLRQWPRFNFRLAEPTDRASVASGRGEHGLMTASSSSLMAAFARSFSRWLRLMGRRQVAISHKAKSLPSNDRPAKLCADRPGRERMRQSCSENPGRSRQLPARPPETIPFACLPRVDRRDGNDNNNPRAVEGR